VSNGQAQQADQPEQAQDEAREEERRIVDRNYELFEELEHRELIIRSNRYEEEDRQYYVERVEKAYLDGGTGYIPCVRLVNEGVRPSLQPVLKMPRSPIDVEQEGDLTVLHLTYTREPSVEQSFHYMNRHERPDLKISIRYRS